MNNNNSNKLTISEETRQKTNYTPSKNNKKHIGFVYIRVYVKNGKIYIGETKNMLNRNYHFRSLAVVYGGKRIEEARKLLGVSSDDWKWDILERVEANSDKELEAKLKQKEAEYITCFPQRDTPNQDFAISTSNCWSLDIFSTVVCSRFVSGSV